MPKSKHDTFFQKYLSSVIQMNFQFAILPSVLLLAACNPGPSDPEVVGTAVTYNCFQSMGFKNDGYGTALLETGPMFGLTLAQFTDGSPPRLATCEPFDKDDHPCDLALPTATDLEYVQQSEILNATWCEGNCKFLVDRYVAEDKSVVEIAVSQDGIYPDFVISETPGESGLFEMYGFSCEGKKEFNLGRVDLGKGNSIIFSQPKENTDGA